ncbi:MAG TPA: M56 family metallopeptidase [Gemmatimonadaceae bacterium]|nr:M56 family metallopeptidase [Gemmatimonadaceae bacterium]
MTLSTLLTDLIAWSAQVACIVAIGGMLPTLLRLDVPGVRYTYFRALLALCLALPWMQGRQTALARATMDAFAPVLIGVSTPSEAMSLAPTFPWLTALGVCIALGILGRGAWIAVGLRRLARLRTAGYVLPWNEEHDEPQRALGTRAEIRYVAGLRQPVTFGVRRPIVLLPDSLRAHPLHVQRAILCHELIHVQRRDWMWLVGEEAVRAVFWFHPGVWWLISRVQLAREEVVDELAMLATGTRRAYIEALAAFADETPLVPVAAFARRRHLFRRMRLIAREAGMSSKRIAWSCAVMALVVAAGSWYAVGAFPLTEAAQDLQNEVGPLEKQAKPITPENPLPRRTYSVDPIYPAEAAAVDANAMVTLMITLDQFGRVAEIRRLGVAPIASVGTPQPDPQTLVSAYGALVRSAADAVRQWTYDAPAESPIAIRVSIAFPSTGKPRLVAHDGWSMASPGQFVPFGAAGGRGGAPASAAAPPPPPPPPPPSDRDAALAAERARAEAAATWATGAVRVGGAILQPRKTKHVNPTYPAVAQSAGVQGVVILEALIGTDGKISKARVLRSVPLLDQAAIDAVMQWEFTPTLLNGQPVPVLMTMTVQFTLS